MNILMNIESFVMNHLALSIIVLGALCDSILLRMISHLYDQTNLLAWWKCLIGGLLATIISSIYGILILQFDSLIHLIIMEIVLTIATMIVFGLLLGVHKTKHYLQMVISYYVCYIVLLLGNYTLTTLSLVFVGPDFTVLSFIIPYVFQIIYILLIYNIVRHTSLHLLISKISQYKLISILVVATILFDSYFIARYLEETMIMIKSAASYNNLMKEYTVVLLIVFLINIVVISFASFMFVKLEKIKQQENELLQQQLYIKKMEELQNDMRAFKHDYKNILASMYLQAQEGDMEAVQSYLAKLLDEVDQRIGQSITMSTNLSNIKVIQMKSSLLVKLMELESAKIRYTIEIPYKITSIGMSIPDFSRCLGILIDNAKEEVENMKNAHIAVVLLQEQDVLHIMVKNSVKEKPSLNQIWVEGYSSKGNARGFGLTSYQSILNHYSNIVRQTKYEDGEFLQAFSVSEV